MNAQIYSAYTEHPPALPPVQVCNDDNNIIEHVHNNLDERKDGMSQFPVSHPIA